ncbi:hypothetical protein QTP70_013346 [Hemibagrus guttatus]|uniref:Reverse transcriptase/retrotransposon-derived protein RNase H-like domain-containing protein n=1 Tax=Hemibagrus guttatus TaxID=175788 RepID=A0AAE0RAZ5_9TELE|nr:hypothetical protein QTP70_013346 [Hemibagrus guttatus]KAK3569685.1 hypothetical protein QTP86_002613 [Hemibagrus guttatus]
MNSSKVQAVMDWPEPTTIKDFQWFLGFANFYHRFIRNYSSIAHPLTSLLRGKPKQLYWMDQARVAFAPLKRSFITAPILRHPDPSLPFHCRDTSDTSLLHSKQEMWSQSKHPSWAH